MKEAYYFSHDANARNDPKVVAMRSVYGYEGYGWYWAIIEMLREEAMLKLSYSKAYAWLNLASSLQTDAMHVRQFVDDCINQFELFKTDGEHFWADSLIRRMQQREERITQLREAGRKGGRSSAQAKLKPSSSNGKAQLKLPSSIKGKERKGKSIEIAPHEQSILDEFAQVDNYPFDAEKDLAHIRKLVADYPNIDLLAEAKKWATYKLDKPLEANSSPRNQFRTWVSRAKPVPQSPPNTGAARTAEYLAQLEGRK